MGRSLSHAEVANILVEVFASVSGELNYSNQFIQYKHNIESRPILFDTATTFSYNDYFTMQEINHCLSLTTESSPGLDKITYSMLKHLYHNITKVILYTFNKIYQDNIYPDWWKTAIIVPILKPLKDPLYSLTYYPISLTSCLSKLLEKMINIRLMWYLEEGNYISCAQSGFRTNRSTSDHLCQMESYVQQAITNRQHTKAVFFDLTKAYDTALHRGVLNGLYSFGLGDHCLNLLWNSYQTNRLWFMLGIHYQTLKLFLREFCRDLYCPAKVLWLQLTK